MTEATVKLIALYEKYDEASALPRKRSFGDLFKGWFSGVGKSALPEDTDFMSKVETLTGRIAEEGDAEDALSASLLILSRPQNKKFAERDVVFAAMYRNVTKLVPLLGDDGVREVSEAAEKVPRQYRFPVYKDLTAALNERLENHNGQ